MIEATPWLSKLRDHMAAATDRGEPEDLHDLRVATRRLASWLKLGQLAPLRDDLRWLRHAAGAVRDPDVVLDMQPEAAFARWLRQLRNARHIDLRAALGSERVTALLAALESLPDLDRRLARRAVPHLARRALERGRQLELEPDQLDRFHALRRAVRSLRYGLEWLDEKSGALRDFQETSGLAADQAVALRLLDLYPGAPLPARRARVETELTAARAQALEAWPALRDRIAQMT
ncbi:MAG TPA: CHAD domain-containing protein [Kofleriaceae bacterium]|nr:CHAD domain-containing protein [Kofleriaceae bacterium]